MIKLDLIKADNNLENSTTVSQENAEYIYAQLHVLFGDK